MKFITNRDAMPITLPFLGLALSLIIFGFAASKGIVTGRWGWFFPQAVLFAFLWWRFALKYKVLSLLVLIALFEGLFKIVDIGISRRFLGDICLVLMFVVIAIEFQRIIEHLVEKNGIYGRYIIVFLGLVILSLIMGSYLNFGQPVESGIYPARKYFMVLSYFFLVAVNFSENDIIKAMDCLLPIGALLAILILLDVRVLGGGVLFNVDLSESNLRAGFIRFSVSSFLVTVTAIYAFVKAKYSEGMHKAIYIGVTVVCFMEILLCNMTRARIVALLLVLILIGLKRLNWGKGFVLIILFILLSFFPASNQSYLKTLGVEKIVELTKHETGFDKNVPVGNWNLVGSTKGNVKIRVDAAKYLTQFWWQKSAIFGIGVFSDQRFDQDPTNRIALKYGYHISDINALDTFIRFGIFGGLLLILLTVKTFRDIVSIRRQLYDIPQIIIAETVCYVLIYRLLSPTLGNILTTNTILYFGIFFYILQSLGAKRAKAASDARPV